MGWKNDIPEKTAKMAIFSGMLAERAGLSASTVYGPIFPLTLLVFNTFPPILMLQTTLQNTLFGMVEMAGKVKHILCREGRYYARIVVPPELRRILGKSEIREPLGPDKRTAERKAHGVIADILRRIEEARQQAKSQPPLREVARRMYERELVLDDVERSVGGEKEARAFNKIIGPAYATTLRKVAAGAATAEEAEAAIGWMVDDALPELLLGTPERAEALKALAGVRLEALARSQEKDGGELLHREPQHPLLKDTPQPPPGAVTPLGQTRILNEHSVKTLSELLPLFHEERKVRTATADEHCTAVRMIEEFFWRTKVGMRNYPPRHDRLQAHPVADPEPLYHAVPRPHLAGSG